MKNKGRVLTAILILTVGLLIGCGSSSDLSDSVNQIYSLITELSEEDESEVAVAGQDEPSDEAAVVSQNEPYSEDNVEEENIDSVEYGGILGWVVNVENEDEKIEGAEVTAVSTATGETETITTDSSGYFELILAEGKYTLTVTTQGYEDYIWPDGNDFQNPVVVTNEGVNYLDDWIKMTPVKMSRKNYYDSEGTLVYYEVYAYYDNGLLCSSTLYQVYYSSFSEGYYSSGEYTFLYLYDEDWNMTDIVLDALTISDWFDESTGEIILGYEYDAEGKSTKIFIYPETESIEQEKFGVDSSKTEEIYEDYPVVTTEVSSGWAAAYLKDIFAGDEPTDMTECRLIYVNDDMVPEIWMDYGYGYAGAEVYTQNGNSTDCVYFDHGYAEWIEKENLLWTGGGSMDEYYDNVYQIQDGEFVSIGSGVYGAADNANVQYDEQGYPLYDYYWNGVEVTEEEYEGALSSVFDETKAESSYQNIYTYKQCKLLLQCIS
ncbi:MAG: carboxypeptidase-like regulatory domain-containing protein [Lachnospiraceae bacterium]|nr:carboxypeptidase-like regulatory domain-containing protein [Lachnospiraceae bacterium]